MREVAQRYAVAGWSALLAVGALGPALVSRGYVLQGDMVFVPTQPWKPGWLGLDGTTGRFVPGDAFVSLATQVVPGDLVQKFILLATLLAAGLGAARLVGGPLLARLAATTVYVWNPWVYERLAIGQWGVVVGYALLPWLVALGVRCVHEDDRRSWCRLVVVLGLAAITSPSSALVALVVTLAVVWAGGWRHRVVLVAVSAVLNAPWWVPSVLGPGLSAAEGQFEAFATTGESSLGPVASVLSLGGIWKESVVPPERATELVVLAAGAFTIAAVAGLRWAQGAGRDARTPIAVIALLAVAVALLPSVAGVTEVLSVVADRVPAAGMVRDSHRFLAPAGLLLAVGAAGLVTKLTEMALPGRESLRAVSLVMVLWPLACLPSMAWGLNGQYRPVDYPDEWRQVATVMDEQPTVVMPWLGNYRGFPWNEGTASLDPAPRYFPGPVYVDERLIVGDRVISSEASGLAGIDRAFAAAEAEDSSGDGLADALWRAGIRQVLVEKTGGAVEMPVPTGRVRHDGRELTLIDLVGPSGESPFRPEGPPLAPVVLADALAMLLWVGALAGSLPLGARLLRRFSAQH